MDSATATRLADQLDAQGEHLCREVSQRLLRAFPELTQTLRLEERYTPAERLSEVAVARLNSLVRTVLLFEHPGVAEQEIRWAQGVLPRSGVTYEHQATMMRWFFEEARRLPLSPSEAALIREIEQFFLAQVRQAYQSN